MEVSMATQSAPLLSKRCITRFRESDRLLKFATGQHFCAADTYTRLFQLRNVVLMVELRVHSQINGTNA
jgi:hypothetical protein